VSLVLWTWVLSIGGALLFFAAGAAVWRPRAAGDVQLESDRDTLSEEVTRLRRELSGVIRRPVEPAVETESTEMTTAIAIATATARSGLVPIIDPDVAVELDGLRRRAADADEIRQENVALRAAANRADGMARRIAELERELELARREGLAARQSRPLPAKVPRRKATETTAVVALLEDVSRTPGVTSAVIADDLGLLVAGSGDHAVAMAAVGGYLAGVGARTRDLVGMTETTRIVVEDDAGLAIAATPLPGSTLIAVTASANGKRR